MLVKIAEATGCDLTWLLKGEDRDARASHRSLVVQDIQPGYGIPAGVAGDERLQEAIKDLDDVLRGEDREAGELLLRTIKKFAADARRSLGMKRGKVR